MPTEAISSNSNSVTIDRTLSDFIRAHDKIGELAPIVDYALFPGGKRIRPLLALSVCEDLGGESEKMLLAAVALELLHAASLIHDDLPCLDNDDMRRGKPSCHRQFGQASALLAGDLMIALAFDAVGRCPLEPQRLLSMNREISGAFVQLCVGQKLDIGAHESPEEIQRVHELKTGALFSACVTIGAIAAGTSEAAVEKAREIGKLIGLGFQVVDDFIDLFGTDLERGREGSSDARNEKRTFFNTKDPGQGLEFLAENRRQIETALAAFSSSFCRGLVDFQRLRILLDAIFARVKGKIPCGC